MNQPGQIIQVLHVVQAVSLGGAVRALLALVPYLGTRYAHTILSISPGQVDPDGVKLAASMGVRHLVATSLAEAHRHIEAADLVHVHWWNNPELGVLLSSTLPPARIIGWLHVGGHEPPQFVTEEVVRYFDVTVACSPFTREAPGFEALTPEEQSSRAAMIYGATDFGRLVSAARRPHSGFNVGYVGTVDFVKMHPDYVALSAAVDIPDVKFVVCGSGRAESTLKQQAAERGLSARFDIRGYVQDVKSILETLDVYGYPLCPETYAAAELNLQEAMYLGIPPVVFPYGGLKRLVIQNFTGFIVNSGAEYKDAIEFLYRNPVERERISKNASEYARQVFGSENAANAFRPIYERLMSEPKRSHHWNDGKIIDIARRGIRGNIDAVKMRGTSIFVASLGPGARIFERSLGPGTDADQLEAERLIACSSELMRSSGIGQFARSFPSEPYLRLWAGLVALDEKRHQEALIHFSEAFNNGLSEWRVLWYVSKAASMGGDAKLATDLVSKIGQLWPGVAVPA